MKSTWLERLHSFETGLLDRLFENWSQLRVTSESEAKSFKKKEVNFESAVNLKVTCQADFLKTSRFRLTSRFNFSTFKPTPTPLKPSPQLTSSSLKSLGFC